MLKVTTSWDDGDILDQRVAELLSRCGMTGTFYITKDYRPNRLSETQIQSLATQHEIGAHTLTHPDLRQLPPQEQLDEITGSKQWLEKVLGKEIKMFCYPKGLYSETVIHTVQTAGFMGARTTQLGSLSTSANSFTLPTTLQIYPFPFRKLTQHQYYWQKLFEPYQQRATALQYLGVSLFSMHSWLSTAKATFDAALKRGGIFHLWGHSWEIEKYGMWEDLEQLCAYITQYPQCKHLTNSETLS